MDLVIAVLQLAAVVNVRQTDAASRRLAATSEEHPARWVAAVIRQELALYSIPEMDTVASRDRAPEVEQTRIAGPRRIMEFHALSRIQHPDADTIPICRRFGTAREVATRLAAVFDIHPEQDGPRRSPAILDSPIAHTGEHNLVRWSATRLRSGDPVTRIAHVVRRNAGTIQAAGIQIHSQARAIQRVEEPGVEVTFHSTIVPDMRPAAMDADIANNVFNQPSSGLEQHVIEVGALIRLSLLVRAVRGPVAVRRADLATVRDVLGVSRADLRNAWLSRIAKQILSATTGHSAEHLLNHCAGNFSTARGGVSNGDVVRRAGADIGRRRIHFCANHYRVVRGWRARQIRHTAQQVRCRSSRRQQYVGYRRTAECFVVERSRQRQIRQIVDDYPEANGVITGGYR